MGGEGRRGEGEGEEEEEEEEEREEEREEGEEEKEEQEEEAPLCCLPRMCFCGNEITLFFEVVVSSWVEQGPILPAVHRVHPHRVVRASVLQSCQEFC